MTTLADVYQAGIDAVVADNTISRGDFADAMRTVATTGVSNAEATDYVDAVAAEFQRFGMINNPTYNNLRGNIINDPLVHAAIYSALSTIHQLDARLPIESALKLQDLREERDNINGALTRCDDLIAAEPPGVVGRLVKEVLRAGKDHLRGYREEVRNQIQTIVGDPDG